MRVTVDRMYCNPEPSLLQSFLQSLLESEVRIVSDTRPLCAFEVYLDGRNDYHIGHSDECVVSDVPNLDVNNRVFSLRLGGLAES